MSGQDLPRYRCHKEVRALKIAGLGMVNGEWLLTPADAAYTAFAVPFDYVEKHQPKAGGYYVVYTDGYTSYSPAAAFENGYMRIGSNIDLEACQAATSAAEAAGIKVDFASDPLMFLEVARAVLAVSRADSRSPESVARALEAAAAELKRLETADPALVVYPRPAPSKDTCIDGDIDLAALVRAVLSAGG